jgi:hypothetical protein
MARADTILQLTGALSIPAGALFDGISFEPAPPPEARPKGGYFGIEGLDADS